MSTHKKRTRVKPDDSDNDSSSSSSDDDFPGVVIKRARRNEKTDEAIPKRGRGRPRKKRLEDPTSSDEEREKQQQQQEQDPVRREFNRLKQNAVEKMNEDRHYPDEKDNVKAGGVKIINKRWTADPKFVRQLPTDENGLLPEWDPETMGTDYTIAVFGKRRTGKSWIMRYLLYLKRQCFNYAMVITNTKFNGFWQNYFPMNVVHGAYDREAVMEFMMVALRIKMWNEANPDKKINHRCVLVLDDIIADPKLRYCPVLATLFYNGRHFGICVMIASQYVFGLPPGLRGNADLIFVLSQVQFRQRDALEKDYAGGLNNQDEFYEVLDDNTKDNRCLVIDQSNPSKPVESMYFQWKSIDPGLFEIGSFKWKSQMWLEGEYEMKKHYTFK